MGLTRKIAASCAALFMSASAAAAADWTGPYLGVFGGYAWFDKHWDAYEQGTTSPLQPTHDVSFSGDLYGVEGGLRFTAGPFVLGVEASWAWVNAVGEFAFPGTEPELIDTSCDSPPPCRTTVHSLATLTGQLGLPIGPALIYGELGAAVAQENFNYVGGGQVDFDFTNYGWLAGVGVVLASQSGLYFKAEYNYIDFGGPEFFGNAAGVDYWLTQTAHVVTLSLGIGF